MSQSQITWFQIPVTNMERAKNFYQKVFGWQVVEFGGPHYQAARVDGRSIGALCMRTEAPPTGDGPLIFFGSRDINSHLQKVTEFGGKVELPRTIISPEVGHWAEFIDCEGNRIALYEEPQDVSFRFSPNIAINVRRGSEAVKFYQEVLGLELKEASADCGTVMRAGPLNLYFDDTRKEDEVGKVFFEFVVRDVANAASRLERLGCTLGTETSGSDFKGVMVTDPYGMRFHLYQTLGQQ